MFRDFVVNYKNIVVHACGIFDKYRAVIDHPKDIVVMSGNKYVLTRYKTVNYSDLLMQTLYVVAKYMRNGTMYMCKMGTFPLFIDATT
ncbi:hypothetical protein [Sphingobacterium chuzhouense]|uniref:Uncharacterized protein n=1 Tax=Sphingobacterium chuzhouense TaxID=1742264 RepID=A0ABR7XPQ2_9SPHI|nr:hypothetical protein [Sphingobacterium chuzhouense]MBD1421149.1 hypothetical protein [Sphingobacterium chuzhouense]